MKIKILTLQCLADVMKRVKILLGVFLFLCAVGMTGGYMLLKTGVSPVSDKAVLFIPTGSEYKDVLDTIGRNLKVENMALLNWVAERKGYKNRIRPGKYVVEREMSSLAFIDMLRSGNQVPVKITFNNIRTISQIAGKVGKQIETDSSAIMEFFSDPHNYEVDGFNRATVISVFIPDTYEMFWNSTPADLYKRMLREYKRFWNEDRKARAEQLGLSPVDVSVLASIIDDEVSRKEEKPRIAGVYLNRLRRGMPLQACPTIKFAINDFTITRVLTRYLKVDSPYNTYKYKGLPPGPVGCPTREGLEAVLNAESHDYLFFAAKADFSGTHNFSRTLREHNRYADEYQRELDRRKIFR
jgi:UPF0755 protein